MKYQKLDWMIIEAFDKNDAWLKRSYWEAVDIERKEKGKELAEQIKSLDDEFRKFLIESGVIDNTLKYLFDTCKNDNQVRDEISKNNLDKLAKQYNLQNEFNEAYKKYKRLSK